MDSAIATIGHNSAIPVYAEFIVQLDELRGLNAAATFDYKTPRGNRDARSHVHKLRQTKGAVETARKEEKAESLAYGRLVDGQAKTIKEELDEMIDLHAKPLQEIEDHEAERIAAHESNLAELKGAGEHAFLHWADFPLDALKDRLAEVEAEPLGEEYWEEFALPAAEAKAATIITMRDAIAKREKQEAEQAELERLRAEAEERKQAEHEEEIRQAAAQRATEEAEGKAEEERARAEAAATKDRDDAERRELELKLAAEKSEREKVEAEQRAANAAKEAEANAARQAAEKAEQEAAATAKREANKKHRAAINRSAAAAFVKSGLAEDTAKEVVTLIAQKAIPHIQISY